MRTDRVTGNSLGPLTGTLIKQKLNKNRYFNKNIFVYGDLENPVHAKNITEIIRHINMNHPNALVVAIDACLGNYNNIGNILIEMDSMSPGKAMSKKLSVIGDISIWGTVNFSYGNAMENFSILQNTRLHTVMKLSEEITNICIKGAKYYSHYLDMCEKNLKIS